MSNENEKQINEFDNFQLEIDKINDKFLRCMADKENIKKRYEKDKKNAIQFANEKLLKDILVTLDNFEHALKSDMTPEVYDGIELIRKNLMSTLKSYNVSEMVYDTFNPNYHQAVQQIDGDTSGKIVEIHQKGYLLYDKLLRPAMVTVSK